MTLLFHDVHEKDKIKTKSHRVGGANYDEILFADDTICMSGDAKALTRLLNKIEEQLPGTTDWGQP